MFRQVLERDQAVSRGAASAWQAARRAVCCPPLVQRQVAVLLQLPRDHRGDRSHAVEYVHGEEQPGHGRSPPPAQPWWPPRAPLRAARLRGPQSLWRSASREQLAHQALERPKKGFVPPIFYFWRTIRFSGRRHCRSRPLNPPQPRGWTTVPSRRAVLPRPRSLALGSGRMLQEDPFFAVRGQVTKTLQTAERQHAKWGEERRRKPVRHDECAPPPPPSSRRPRDARAAPPEASVGGLRCAHLPHGRACAP